MIFDEQGKVFSKIEFKDEAEVEQVVFDNFNLLFGDYSILLSKSLISTAGGKGTIPDGIIFNFQELTWFILEVERGIHGTWEHIAPQIVKQITAMQNDDSKNKMAENAIKEIEKKPGFKDLLAEIEISEINIHGTINKILKKSPIVALPIDFIPSDLEDWAKSLRVPVKIWLVEKYSDLKGNVLFNIPDIEIDTSVENLGEGAVTEREPTSDVISKVVKGGFLVDGQEVFFEYGPKGKSKNRYTGIVRINGIEVDGVVSSPSISSLRCIQKSNPSRTTSNGWKVWKTMDGKLINEAWEKLDESETRATET